MNLKLAVTAGVASLVAGAALQGLYKVTKFYPPAPVFWFAIGFTAHVVVDYAKKKKLLTA